MEFDKILKERRTIRKYSDKEVSLEKISQILEASRHAPCAGNIQNYRFVVVRNKSLKEKIVKTCEDQQWMNKAPVLIIVCSELTSLKRLYGPRGEALYSVQNTAAAIENIILKAQDIGLATAWIGAFDEEKITELLKITKDARPQAILTLGYAKGEPEAVDKEPLDNLVYFEEYTKREDKTLKPWPIGKKVENIINKIGEKISKKEQYP